MTIHCAEYRHELFTRTEFGLPGYANNRLYQRTTRNPHTMKRTELFFSAVLLPLDYLMLILAGLSAYSLRFDSFVTEIQPVVYEIPLSQFMMFIVITAAVWVMLFAIVGMYKISGTRRIIEETRRVITACSTGVMLIIIVFFFERDLFSSRFIILAAYGFALIYILAARVIVIYIERYLFRRGYGIHNVVLVGNHRITEIIESELKRKHGLGFHVKFTVETFNDAAQQKILQYIEKGKVDDLIQTDPNMSKKDSEKLFEFCNEHHLTFKYAAALFDTQSSNIEIQPIAGIPIVEVKKTPLDGWGRIVKRLFDIIGSLGCILLTLPIMLVTAIAIRLDSKGPIFFTKDDDGKRVKRVGQNAQPFFYFKFRSMQPGTHNMRYNELAHNNLRKDSPLVKIDNDPRITRVGKFIRRFSIDELPEFFLVLRGDMSLVGPRPHLPEEVAKYKKHHKRVLSMKPGITGLAQISGRSDLGFEDEVRLDTFYMENWALWLDLVILVKTPFILFKRRKAL